jgi:hypothetical protein
MGSVAHEVMRRVELSACSRRRIRRFPRRLRRPGSRASWRVNAAKCFRPGFRSGEREDKKNSVDRELVGPNPADAIEWQDGVGALGHGLAVEVKLPRPRCRRRARREPQTPRAEQVYSATNGMGGRVVSACPEQHDAALMFAVNRFEHK